MGVKNSKNKQVILNLIKEKNASKARIQQLEDRMEAVIAEVKVLGQEYSKSKGIALRACKRLKSEKEKTLKRIKSLQFDHASLVLRSLCKICKPVLFNLIFKAFNKWMNMKYNIYIQPLETTIEVEAEAIFADEDIAEASAEIEQNYCKMVKKSVILDILRKNSSESEETMNLKQLLMFFENVSFSKYMHDIRCIDSKQQPFGYPEFLLEFLHKKYLTPEQVIKVLGKIVRSIEKFKKTSDYIQLIAGFLQITVDGFVSFNMSVYLHRVILELDKGIKMKNMQGIDFCSSPTASKVFEGGLLYLTDAIDIIYVHFPKKKIKTLLFGMLRPQNVSKEQYFLFIISYLLNKIGVLPDQFFDLLDEQGKTYIKARVLIEGFEKHLKMWLLPEDYIKIYTAFGCFHSKNIHRSQFISQFSVDPSGLVYSEKKNYSVTKYCVLKSLLQMSKLIEIKATANLFRLFSSRTETEMDLATFQSILAELSPDLPNHITIEMFHEGKRQRLKKKGLNRKDFSSVLIHHGLGDKNLKFFSNIYLDIINVRRDFKRHTFASFSAMANYQVKDSASTSPTMDESRTFTNYTFQI